MPLFCTNEHTEAIQAHATTAYPSECCGFLIGTLDRGGNGRVSEAVPAGNTRTETAGFRYEIDSLEHLHVEQAARRNGLGVIGFYHSHPDAPARPSEYDREHAWPGYYYVITAVEAGRPGATRAWRLRDDGSAFDEDPIFAGERDPHARDD